MSSKHSLHKVSLYIANAEQSLEFYQNQLGMTLLESSTVDGVQYLQFSFDPSPERKEAILELICDPANIACFPKDRNSLEGYWKIAISIKDVDIARQKLLDQGVEVTDAFQVPDVAYLCHFYDPNGYCLELIQHKFQHNHTTEPENTDYVLGNRPVLSLVTYRAKNIDSSLAFYNRIPGLKLLSKMAVSQRGFDLYFLGYSAEEVTDVESLTIRESLWQKNTTMIELQHIFKFNDESDFQYKVGAETGFKGLTLKSEKAQILHDPDGYRIEVI
ncbi:VOC family protein [Endozoicomonadaceae bacterium StTr2]